MTYKTTYIRIRVDSDMKQWMKSLKKYYDINQSQFIREAIIEKMQKDVPKLRLKKESDKNRTPF